MTTPTPNAPTTAPVQRLRLDLLHASIWRRDSDKGAFYSATFERRYRDSDGNWQSTQSYNGDDLLLLAKLADQVHSAITQLRLADKS